MVVMLLPPMLLINTTTDKSKSPMFIILSPPPPRHEWKCISHTPGDIYGEPAAVQYISANRYTGEL